MPSIIKKLEDRKLVTPPSWLSTNVAYEAVTGSIAYGVNTDVSDFDVVGFCIPPKIIIFPHLDGVIHGFGRQQKQFNVYQQHHIWWQEDLGGKGRNYDISIYNIISYFKLCMECNPNMIDSLFVPRECILHTTQIGEMVREGRHLFLHKDAWFRYKGYAYSQLHKIKTKTPQRGSKREAIVKAYSWDTKFGYHTIRLLYEIEQILEEGDLDLRKNSEHLKAIRRGDLSQNEVVKWAAEKEKHLEKLYETSSLQYKPNEEKIKHLLLHCLEHAYGSLDKCVVIDNKSTHILGQIAEIIEQNKDLIMGSRENEKHI